jgi:hypothetical protein
VRSTDGVGLQAAQAKMRTAVNRAGNFESLRGRTRAGAMIAHVKVDQEIDGAPRGGVPLDLPDVIDNRHRAGSRDTSDLRWIGKRRGEQDAADPMLGHELGLGNGGDGDSGCTVLDLTPGDFDAFVRLGVRPQLFARLLHPLRHACEVGFEKIKVEQQRGRRDLRFRKHDPLCMMNPWPRTEFPPCNPPR